MPDSQQTAERVIKAVATLPPLPASVSAILATFGNEFIDADQVCAVVEQDAAISAKLLGLSNSAYFAQANPVNSVRDAVARVLGVDTVRSLVFAMAVRQSCNSSRCGAFDPQKFWMHSLMTSHCCRQLAARDDALTDEERELASTAGLCHNLGLMALAHLEPLRTHKVIRSCQSVTERCALSGPLTAEFGFDHRVMTMALARHWSLPELLVSAYEARAARGHDAVNRLGQIVAAAAAAVGNIECDVDHPADLSEFGDALALPVSKLQEMALPSERAGKRLQTLAASMA